MLSDKAPLQQCDIRIVLLNAKYALLLDEFSCGHEDEDIFLKKDALIHQNLRLSQTYLLLEGDRERIISYITFSVGSFRLDKGQTIKGVQILDKPTRIYNNNLPCLFVGKLATHKQETRRGGGRHMLNFAIRRALELNREIAIPFIALDAYANQLRRRAPPPKGGGLIAHSAKSGQVGCRHSLRSLKCAVSLPTCP